MTFRLSFCSRILFSAALLVIVVPAINGQSCLRSFDGEWKTNYGTMPIWSSGDQASARYGSGRTLTGTIRGSVFAGHLEVPERTVGPIPDLSMMETASSRASGERKDGALTSNWTGSCGKSLPGTRVSSSGTASPPGTSPPTRPGSPGASPAGPGLTPSVGSGGSAAGCATTFAGRWKTNFGELTISVRGNEAAGSYGSGRTVTGLINGSWGMHLTPEAPRSSIRALEDYSRTLGSFKSASPSGFKVNRCRPPAGRNERRL